MLVVFLFFRGDHQMDAEPAEQAEIFQYELLKVLKNIDKHLKNISDSLNEIKNKK